MSIVESITREMITAFRSSWNKAELLALTRTCDRFVSLSKIELKQSKRAWMKEGTTVSWKGIAQSGKRNSLCVGVCVCVCKTMMYYPMGHKTFSQVLYDQSSPHRHTHLKTSAVHSAELSEVSRETNTNSGDVCCGPTSCPKRAINLGKSPPSFPSNFTYGSFYHLQGTHI